MAEKFIIHNFAGWWQLQNESKTVLIPIVHMLR